MDVRREGQQRFNGATVIVFLARFSQYSHCFLLRVLVEQSYRWRWNGLLVSFAGRLLVFSFILGCFFVASPDSAVLTVLSTHTKLR